MSALARVCRIVTGIYVVLYVAALALFLTGTLGLFGQPRDPLAGVFLAPLGLPWTRMVDVLPEATWPWLGVAAPMVNVAILMALCRMLGHAGKHRRS